MRGNKFPGAKVIYLIHIAMFFGKKIIPALLIGESIVPL
jgi:hypothetical protein